MSKQVKLWSISGDRFTQCDPQPIDLEARLQAALEHDISILSPALLVIGKEVPTDLGLFIDLLCVNPDGDLVVVELKRGRTPREVVAQVLDYGAWVQRLSHDEVMTVANNYLADRGPLESAFFERFGAELPEALNGSHDLLVVATSVDPRTERVIEYLSTGYGVPINVATIQVFCSPNGDELLVRVFLIEPEEVDHRARSRNGSKRRRNLTLDELDGLAEENGVADLYRCLAGNPGPRLRLHTTQSSIVFAGDLDGSRKAILSLIPGESDPERGLRFQVYLERFQQLFDLGEEEALAVLPAQREPWKYFKSAGPDWSGFVGFVRDEEEAERLQGVVAGQA